jgi:hypothetical protein
VEWYKEGYFPIRSKMLDLSESEGKTQLPQRIITALTRASVEVEGYHDGFCQGFTKDDKVKRCYMGNCTQIDEVCVFHSDM